MGGTGHEVPLRSERRLQPGEQPVKGVGEFLELVVWPGQGEPLVQAGRGDPLRGPGDGAQRPEHPAGHQPAERERERGHHDQREAGLLQQRVQVERACLPCSEPRYAFDELVGMHVTALGGRET